MFSIRCVIHLNISKLNESMIRISFRSSTLIESYAALAKSCQKLYKKIVQIGVLSNTYVAAPRRL